MTVELTTAEKIRRLPWNTALQAANSVFATLTFFGSAFILFVNEIGASNSQIGFLLSLLPFTGLIALFIAPQVARFGYKRTWVTFFTARKFITAGLLFVPWVAARFGSEPAFAVIAFVVIGFALCRAIAETALYPWSQEFIPNSVRGKHAALNDMVARITGIIATAFAGYVLGSSTDLRRFIIIFAVALIAGVISAWSSTHLPGGEPTTTQIISYRNLFSVLRDRNFNQYIAGIGMIALAGAPLSFLPLFLRELVGLTDSTIVWLGIGGTFGGLSSTYLMGWAADRYGSKPVLLLGLYLKALISLGWLFIPRGSDVSTAYALMLFVISGVVDIGWGIGSGRLLFTKVVPHERRGEYMAVYYAAIGLIGGFSQIVSGALLDATAGISGQLWIFPIDQFMPLFLGSVILMFIGALIFQRVQPDSDVSFSQFTEMFRHGNPVFALTSVANYYRAVDEEALVSATERMGRSKSPLTVEELLETLIDPRFNVRFEAVISIARMGPEPRLVDALCRIVDGTEISLSVIAAWALGRMGSERALPTLRQGLDARYRSLQVHCARSLGTLKDLEVASELLERLRSESDKGMQMAYASALGNLQYRPALMMILALLDTTQNEGARMELALAAARIADDERPFIGLLRGLRNDMGTTAAQAIEPIKRRLSASVSKDTLVLIDRCSMSFARNQYDSGAAELAQIIEDLVVTHDDPVENQILSATVPKLRESGVERVEYLVLALLLFQEAEW
jgi:MFS family permease